MATIKRVCPCDIDGICPYADMHSGYMGSCEYWCGAEEPQDEPGRWDIEPSRDDWDMDEDRYCDSIPY